MKHLPMLLAITLCLPTTLSASPDGRMPILSLVTKAIEALPIGFTTGLIAGVLAAKSPQKTVSYASGSLAIGTAAGAAIDVTNGNEDARYCGTVLSLVATAGGFFAGLLAASMVKPLLA